MLKKTNLKTFNQFQEFVQEQEFEVQHLKSNTDEKILIQEEPADDFIKVNSLHQRTSHSKGSLKKKKKLKSKTHLNHSSSSSEESLQREL